MNLSQQLAKHFREVNSGGNWTWSNLKDNLTDVTWEQATTKIPSYNTIAALVYHIHYYIEVLIPVLQGGKLDGSDKYSFDVPPIHSKQEWDQLLEKTRRDAETFAGIIEKMPETKLWENFPDPKYGNWLRNILGVIEHTHYHLGQIVILKKMIQSQTSEEKTN